MLKIQEITRIVQETYKGVQYPVIEAIVIIDDNEEFPATEYFGTQSLGEAIIDDNGNPRDREALHIDENIYAYVPNDLHSKTNEEIKKYIENEIE